MHKYIFKQLDFSFIQARRFFEESILEINHVYGFPEYKGKQRITEWGGTSSAISSISLLGNNVPLLATKIEISKQWLISQNKDGAWNASGFFSLEATAGVMNDLYEKNIIPEELISSVLKYIWNSYNHEGFFITSSSNGSPHVYTNYLALKCLFQYSNIPKEQKTQIIDWLLSIRNHNGKWGICKDSEESVSHSVYALYILNYCGISWEVIKDEYKDLIAWILKNYKKSYFYYEEFEHTNDDSDSAGQNFLRLRISHYVLPLVGNLSIDLNAKIETIRITKAILKTQRNGGWGPPDSRLTMWATHQAIAYCVRFKDQMIKRIKVIDILRATFPFLEIRIILTVCAVVLFYVLIQNASNLLDLAISLLANIIFAIYTWLIKRP